MRADSHFGLVMKMSANYRLWLMRLLTAVVAPLLFFALLEGALRLFQYGAPAGFLIRQGDSYISNDRFGWRFFPKSLATSPCPLRVAVTKPEGTCRILILGESAAEGTPNPSFGFGRMLEAMLRLQYPEKHFEVINAAMTAINSHVIRLIAQDCRQLKPDWVVVYMGNNEVVGPFGPGTAFGGSLTHRQILQSGLSVRSTRTGQLIQNLLSGSMGTAAPAWRGMEMFLDHPVSAEDPRLAAVYDSFRANLGDICDSGRAAGAQTILATVASNLQENPPFASVHRPDLSETELGRWRELFQAGVARATAGHDAEALESYRQAAQIDGGYAELLFRMAEAHRRLQQFDQALTFYRQARDHDALRFRADSRINQIIRETAAARQGAGVFLADVEEAFGRGDGSGHGIPADALFYEHVHPTPQGNFLLAKTVRGQISGLPPAELPTLPACAQVLALTELDEFRLSTSMAEMTARPPFTNQLDHSQRQARRLEQLDRFRSQSLPTAWDRAKPVYEAAMLRSPGDWQIRDNLAHVLMERGGLEASIALWQSVLPELPANSVAAAEVHLNLGEAVGRVGQYDKALVHFQEAAKSWRQVPNAHRGLGEIYMLRGELKAAAAEFSEAIRLNPNHVPAINGLGMVRYKSNDLPGAVEAFSRALAIEPSAAIHLNLGIVRVKQGQWAEAAQHYRLAIQYSPGDASLYTRLAIVLALQGKDQEAISQYRQALRIQPDPTTTLELAWLLAASKDDRARNGTAAVTLAEPLGSQAGMKSPQVLDVLAAAYAEAGRFDDAVATAGRAIDAAAALGDSALVGQLRARQQLYQAYKPFRKP